MGIEPTLFAWEARVLPLNDARRSRELRLLTRHCHSQCCVVGSNGTSMAKHFFEKMNKLCHFSKTFSDFSFRRFARGTPAHSY